MARLSQLHRPAWRQRLALLSLILGALLVGIAADLAAGRRPDNFNLINAGLTLLLSLFPADVGLSAIKSLARVRPAGARWLLAGATGILCVASGYALPTFLSGLVNTPRIGLWFLADVFAGLAFTLQQALIPAVVIGAIAGALAAWLTWRAPG